MRFVRAMSSNYQFALEFFYGQPKLFDNNIHAHVNECIYQCKSMLYTLNENHDLAITRSSSSRADPGLPGWGHLNV